MKTESNMALVIGLGLIVSFAVVLHALKGSALPTEVSAEDADEFAKYSLKPVVQDVAPKANSDASDSPKARQLAIGHPRVPRGLKSASRVPSRRDMMRTRRYVVRPNDSLVAIARKHYGKENQDLYRLIFQANRDVLSDASTVRVGQELVIPPLKRQSVRNEQKPFRSVAQR